MPGRSSDDRWQDVKSRDFISRVGRESPYPTSQTLKAVRASLPNLLALVPGDRVFVTSLDGREDALIAREIVKANKRISGRRLLALLEWRSHVRGRLILCVHPSRYEMWTSLKGRMTEAIRINRGLSPPLDVNGNALVPRLPQEAE